ncbi:hypothetical protein L2E82_04210 [Cichorium intybus]|uniref:Uncharacterized protein n=1 Tax=Cichorium intybus TaxID=13427 RepID=A0ACB9H5Y5_CICIN|nr:hypothetical protein L2E82_04210 [Cichorium intybus]
MESVAASKASGVDIFGFRFVEDALVEDWVKQLEEVSGSQDMESTVQTMMQQVLSEEVVDDPINKLEKDTPSGYKTINLN